MTIVTATAMIATKTEAQAGFVITFFKVEVNPRQLIVRGLSLLMGQPIIA